MKTYVPVSYEEEIYCLGIDNKTNEWMWIKTEKPHDYKAAEQKLMSLGKQFVTLADWYTYNDYLFWSSDDEPLL